MISIIYQEARKTGKPVFCIADDKSQSKIALVQKIADELPVPPVISYFLCDSWYTTGKLYTAFVRKGFYMIGALKTDRIIFPCGIRQSIREFAQYIKQEDCNVSLVTVGRRRYYVYRYEGKLNSIGNAVVLLTYPENAFHEPKALRAFLCADVSLTTPEILEAYTERWPIEMFFRQSKGKLCSFDEGYSYFKQTVCEEQIAYIYHCGAKNIPLKTILSLAA